MLEREGKSVVDGKNFDLWLRSAEAIGPDEPVLGGPVGIADDVVEDDDTLELILEDGCGLLAHRTLLQLLPKLRELDGVVDEGLEGADLRRKKIDFSKLEQNVIYTDHLKSHSN